MSYQDIEEQLGGVPGVTCPGLDLATLTIGVAFDDSVVSRDELLAHIAALGIPIGRIAFT